jgi:hypothetical protein
MACEYGYDADDPASLTASLVSRMPDIEAKAHQFLRDAALTFFQESMIWRDQRALLNVTPASMIYAVPSYEKGEPCKIIDIYAPSSRDHDEWKIPEHREVHQDSDQRWYSNDAKQIQFHRPFAHGYQLRLHVALRPASDHRANGDLLVQWREPILAYAQHLANLMPDSKTENMRTADFYLQRYRQGVQEAKRFHQHVLSTDRPSRTRRQDHTRRARKPRVL